MLSLFQGVFDTSTAATSGLAVGDFLICLAAALVLGFVIALFYKFGTRYSKSFLVTLTLLPAIVSVIIMMVNGNIGAGVAVAGAFSLVRFRSAPGTAREIAALFLAMAAGLITGMGYIAYAAIFVVVIGAVMCLLTQSSFGEKTGSAPHKTLRITIPEDLDYAGVFDDLFEQYTSSWRLQSVKTSNMGSLFKLKYDIDLKDTALEKEFIDKLRCRNGNLEISSSVEAGKSTEL